MMKARELKDWLRLVADNERVYIDEGGLLLCVDPPDGGEPDIYIELGGKPLEDDDDTSD